MEMVLHWKYSCPGPQVPGCIVSHTSLVFGFRGRMDGPVLTNHLVFMIRPRYDITFLTTERALTTNGMISEYERVLTLLLLNVLFMQGFQNRFEGSICRHLTINNRTLFAVRFKWWEWKILGMRVIFHSTNERPHWIKDNISNPNPNNSILLKNSTITYC